MTLHDLVNSTCLIGLSYFDTEAQLLKQSQLCGTVIECDSDDGIAIRLQPNSGSVSTHEPGQAAAIFRLPPVLEAWYKAPPGHYRNMEAGVDIDNPDYLVTWDIYQTTENTPEGEHQWWEWIPRTIPPQVG